MNYTCCYQKKEWKCIQAWKSTRRAVVLSWKHLFNFCRSCIKGVIYILQCIDEKTKFFGSNIESFSQIMYLTSQKCICWKWLKFTVILWYNEEGLQSVLLSFFVTIWQLRCFWRAAKKIHVTHVAREKVRKIDIKCKEMYFCNF